LSHKADESFFDRKRPWSKRKDRILSYYLEPYLAKVATLRRPILIVDGFAGPGKFSDGEIGSPLIICEKAREAITRGARVSVACIEDVDDLCVRLKQNLSPYPFATAFCGKFLEHVPHICESAKTHTLFLYLDPCTVEGLDWRALDMVFQHIRASRASVELLLNFNARSFVRRGLAALKCDVPDIDAGIEDSEEPDAVPAHSPTVDHLNQIVGGSWWSDTLASTKDFTEQVKRVTKQFAEQLRERFSEVGYTAIKAKQTHLVPKYYLVFASRHPDALELMNDAMAKCRGTSTFYLDLFARSDLEKLILDLSPDWRPRGDVILDVMRLAFCMFTRAEIRGCIEDQLRAHRLRSETGRIRINDQVKIIRA
jgi:three-Cys-motif partner protein